MRQSQGERTSGRPEIDYDRYRRLAALERKAAIAAFPGMAKATVRRALAALHVFERRVPRLG